MAFTPIDESTWERREYLEVFRRTAVYLTAEVDITSLYQRTKARGEKLYPALVWCVAAVLNRHAHFRYGRDQAGADRNLGCASPYYTVPRRDAPDLFAMKVTRFTPDYDAFLSQFREDCARAETCGRLLCDETLPPNLCGISAVPGAGLLRLQLRRGPEAGLHALCPCWGGSTRQGSGRCCRWAGSFPMPSTTAATSAAFSKNWRRPAAGLFPD